jgi:hypothetical protein
MMENIVVTTDNIVWHKDGARTKIPIPQMPCVIMQTIEGAELCLRHDVIDYIKANIGDFPSENLADYTFCMQVFRTDNGRFDMRKPDMCCVKVVK